MRRIMSIIIITVVTGAAVSYAGTVDSLNPLYETLPAARIVEVANWERIKTPELPFSRTHGVFKGESDTSDWAGTVVHLVTPGYGGPMGVLVAFDPEGRVMKVNVFRHLETDCHILAMTKGRFLDQFIGVSLLEKLKLLIGLDAEKPGEIQAKTGGTITSRAVADAVAEARQVFYSLYSNNEMQPDQPELVPNILLRR